MANTNFKNSVFMTDAILKEDNTSLGVGPNSLVSNIATSGQLGTGVRFTKLDGATPAVFNPVVCIVLNTPSMWDRYPKLQEMLRAVVETHAKSITGIDFGYQLETQDVPLGHDGQQMKVPTRTTRDSVNPSLTVQEYPGMPIYNLFRTWMFDIQHPDTNASVLPSQIANGTTTEDFTAMPGWFMSAYSMSMICIQYDPSGLWDRIYDAAVITNMFPTSIGQIGFERTIGTTQLKERQIEFSGIVQHNEMTKALGISVAKMLAMHRTNYDFALPGLAGTTDATGLTEGTKAFLGASGTTAQKAGMYYETESTRGSNNVYRPENITQAGNADFNDRFSPNSGTDMSDNHQANGSAATA